MTKEELALELLKFSSAEFSFDDDKTKEKVVEAYNYIYKNLEIDEIK